MIQLGWVAGPVLHCQPCTKQCPGLSLGTGYQLLQSLLALIAVDQQHLLDPVLLEAHVTELLPEAQELPCLRRRHKGYFITAASVLSIAIPGAY